jgi:hypothetical protein
MAIRRPISRVRSVTEEENVHDTDPADEQRDGRHGGEQNRHDPAAAFGSLNKLAQIAHRKIVRLAGLDAVTADEHVCRAVDRGLYLCLAHRLQVNLVDVAGQPRLQIVGIRRQQVGAVELRLLLARRRGV